MNAGGGSVRALPSVRSDATPSPDATDVQRGRYTTPETIARWAMIPPSAFRLSPADRSGPCRRTW
ncbi:hypothetical protein XH93_09125 [Bradyrhizobium sp. CCBAU 51753]|nr:hypothetical protein XH93_09125 [Bradyrhizobium sp. CCBAU 51753]